MRKEIIFEMSSPYRDTFRIQGYWFGTGEPSLAIVGPMRGDEAQQQYICATMVNELQRIERRGEIEPGKSILVIPTCNPFSLNVNHRFWSMDGTDINRMFPGYDRGETTQRIAAAIFDKIKSFKYGIQLASFFVPGDFIPHVRMLKTGYEDIDGARLFGLPYITIREPLPFDTTLLNYNWQIWETKAFSLYSGHTETIDEDAALISRAAMLRFMGKTGIIDSVPPSPAYDSVLIDEAELVAVQARHAGILQRLMGVGCAVRPGDVMSRIIDPLNGNILEEVKATVNGVIFFSHHRPLIYQNALIYRIQKA